MDDVEDGAALRADDRIAAEGVEVRALRERGGDVRCCNDRAERATVPDSFRHCHDVGNYVLRFESPVMRAGPTESGLDFISDADSAGGSDMFVSMFQVSIGKNNAAAHALN